MSEFIYTLTKGKSRSKNTKLQMQALDFSFAVKTPLDLLSSCSLFCTWCISYLTCKTSHSPIDLKQKYSKNAPTPSWRLLGLRWLVFFFFLVLTSSSLKNQKRVHKSFPFLLGGLEIVSFIVVENLLSFSNVPRA